MIKYTPPKEKSLPSIQSEISSKYLQPTQWIDELIKKKPNDIFGIIERRRTVPDTQKP